MSASHVIVTGMRCESLEAELLLRKDLTQNRRMNYSIMVGTSMNFRFCWWNLSNSWWDVDKYIESKLKIKELRKKSKHSDVMHPWVRNSLERVTKKQATVFGCDATVTNIWNSEKERKSMTALWEVCKYRYWCADHSQETHVDALELDFHACPRQWGLNSGRSWVECRSGTN